MRAPILLVLALAASTGLAQDDGDALLRKLTDTAPRLALSRAEIALAPALGLGQVSAIVPDASGNLLVLHRNTAIDPIVVTTPTGDVLRTFGRGLFERPHSIRLDPAGNVWAVDSNTSKVFKFSAAGEQLLEIDVGDVPDPENESCAASDVAVDTSGRVFVSDGYCNARIVVYDAAGQKVREWGRAGTGPGELELPHGIALGPDGNVYVADRENGRVQWFSAEGRYLGQWRFGGRVLSVTFSADGELYISAEPKDAVPQQEATLLKIDPRDGRVIGKIEAFGHEISVGPDGALYPASLNETVVVYRP